MSKAFTRESDAPDREEVATSRPQLPPGARNYITRDGADRLKQRLKELLEQKRALTATSNKTGAAFEADQHKTETTIRKLQQILDSVVVAELPVDQKKIAFGAAVTVRHGNGEQEAYRIVGVEEANPERGWISWISPLARALLSRRAGETVRFHAPAGDEDLTVLSVNY